MSIHSLWRPINIILILLSNDSMYCNFLIRKILENWYVNYGLYIKLSTYIIVNDTESIIRPIFCDDSYSRRKTYSHSQPPSIFIVYVRANPEATTKFNIMTRRDRLHKSIVISKSSVF